jgi:hypothetical protein
MCLSRKPLGGNGKSATARVTDLAEFRRFVIALRK